MTQAVLIYIHPWLRNHAIERCIRVIVIRFFLFCPPSNVASNNSLGLTYGGFYGIQRGRYTDFLPREALPSPFTLSLPCIDQAIMSLMPGQQAMSTTSVNGILRNFRQQISNIYLRYTFNLIGSTVYTFHLVHLKSS